MNTAQRQILSLLTRRDGATIPQVAEALDMSVGTATKYVMALLDEGFLEDCGKTESASGRRPHLYRLRADAGWFLGIDANDRYLNVGLMDFRGEMHQTYLTEDFALDEEGAFEQLCDYVRQAVNQAKGAGGEVRNICIALPGRVDDRTGDSHTFFYQPGQALAARLQELAGLPMCLYNDARAMTYGELLKGAGAGAKNMLMINVSWGLGMGIVIDSAIYRGKSGYSGELGHMYGFDNQIICRCGKRGCNETEISGQALQRHLTERILRGETSILSERVKSSDKPLLLAEIKDAVAREDVLCIEALQHIGLRLGEKTAGLINVFNPDRVVLGGELAAAAGDFILDPMRMAVNKHAVHLVSKETEIVRGTLGIDAGAIGACLIARSRYIGERFEI